MSVYSEIANRPKVYEIDLKDYIYVDRNHGTTLQVGSTTLKGIN